MSLATLGKLLIGLGFTAEAVSEIRRGRERASLLGRALPSMNGLGWADTALPQRAAPNFLPGEADWSATKVKAAHAVLVRGRTHTVRDIDERVAYILRLVREGSLNPAVIEAARAVVSTKCGTRDGVRWCYTPKDYKAEVAAIYAAVQNPASPIALRYVRDHVAVDQFARADKLIRLRAGDCDDGTILIGAMLRAIGYPLKLRVIQDISSPSWSHIYLVVGLPPTGPNLWWALDWSVYPWKPAGWEAPERIIKAKRDYPV